jgi:mannose-1-phosphate guanylyltransferase/mannose-6-phosphate isomerase
VEIPWPDVSTWQRVWELSQRDENNNSIQGQGIISHGKSVHVRSDSRLTAVIGVDDVIVVTTQDAVLVLHRERANQVSELVDQMTRQHRREVVEHKRVYRPWGYYQIVDYGTRYQVKRIFVKPGAQISLQKHLHRAEHWIVVKGAARVQRADDINILHENESLFVPIGCVHRISNPGKIDLEMIEVQTGSYLGEDDIVRLEDIYNRINNQPSKPLLESTRRDIPSRFAE